MSLITLGLATDYLTEGGLAATAPITVNNRPFFWQQIERTRANFADILDSLAYIQHARVTLTDAQIKALPTTPITLIAAPASGKRIHLVSASIRTDTAAGAYTNINTTYSAIAMYYLGDFSVWVSMGIVNDNVPTPDITRLTDMIGVAQLASANVTAYNDTPGNGWVLPVNITSTTSDAKALAIAADNNGSGAFTGGNAANSMTVDVLYLELP